MTTGADWVDSARRLLDTVRPPTTAAPAGPPQDATAHGADCRWCPVCQGAAVLRGERPDVTAALADVLATTASVLRDLAGETQRAGETPAPDGAESRHEGDDRHGSDDRGEGDGGPAPAVQRIDIG